MKLFKLTSYTIYITLLTMLATPVSAQNNVFNTLFVSDQKKADQLYQELSYRNALELYQRILRKKPENREAQYKAAQCYLKLNQPDSFIYYMEPLIRYQSLIKPIDKYNLGEASASLGRADKALSYYQAYALEVPDDSRIEKKIASMENRQQFYQDSSKYDISRLPVNSKNSDFAPAFYQEGIVFISSRRHDILVKNIITWNNEPLYNIFYYANGSIKKFSDFEASLLKGPLTFFDQDQKVMFTGSSMKTKEKVGRLQLFTASKEKSGWSEITTFPYNELEYSFAYPTVSKGGDTLIFSSDMPGGMGGMDLYICYRFNGAWSKPENMGNGINTEGNEVFPFISKNNFIYFSSNGHEGLGGLDVYQLDLEKKQKVKNVGAPVNSIRDDFGFIIDGNNGFFSSNRNLEMSDELFSFEYNHDTKDIKPLEIMVSNLETKEEVPYTIKDDIISFWGNNKEKYKIEASLKGYDLELLRTAEKDDTIRFKIPVAPKPPSMQLVAVVKDAATKQVISGANVSITSLALPDQNLVSDDQGKVTFNAEKDDVYLITASKGNRSGIHNDVALISMLDEEIEIFLTEQEIVNNRINAYVVDESTGEQLTTFIATVTELPTKRNIPVEKNGSLFGFDANARHQYEIIINKNGYEKKSHRFYFDPEVNPVKEKIRLGLVPQSLEYTLKGHIFDGITGAPLVNASIDVTSLMGKDQQINSDQYGNFFFEAQEGDVVIVVGTQGEKLGMYNDEIKESDLGKVIQVAAYSGKEKEFVNGTVVDAGSQKPLAGCQMFIVDQKTGQKMAFEQKGAAVNFTANKGTYYKITARKSGYDDKTITLSYLSGEEPYPTNFKIEMTENRPMVAMQGYVFDGVTNQPVAGANIDIISLDFKDQVVKSDANGFFKFKIRLNDAFLATAIKGDKAGLYNAIADEEQIYKTVRIAVNGKDDQFLVAGFVIDEVSGELIDQAEVTIIQSNTAQQSRTNSNEGIFSFHATPGNEYQITAEYPGYEKNTITLPFDRLINDEMGNISVALKPIDASVSVRAFVYDVQSGDPIGNANVEVVSLALPDQQKVTNTTGHVDFEIKVEHEFIVMVTHEQKAGIHTAVVSEEDIHKLIRIGIAGPDDTQKIAGLVMDQETQTPIDAAEIIVVNQTSGDSIEVTQKRGFIEFEATPGETYNILAKKTGYKEATVNLPFNPAQIPAPQDLKINLERHRPEVTLKGLAYDGKTGETLENVNISVTSIVLPDQDITSDKNGEFSFKAKIEEPFVVIGFLEKMGGFYAGKISLDRAEEIIKVALYTREDERIIAGFILDKETSKPIENVRVKVIENNTGQIIPAEVNNGLVSFKGYPGSDYTIRAEKPGYREGQEIIPLSQLKNKNPDNFNLMLEPYQPEILVNAHLYDGKTGKGLPKALINVTGMAMMDTNMVTDENGNFQFKAKVGDVVMVMGSTERKAGYYAGQVEKEWENEVLEVAAHGEDEKHSINGFITDSESGKPIEEVEITVVDLRTGEEVAAEYNKGVLTFDGLEGHDYKIIADKSGYKNTVDYVSLAEGKTEEDPHLVMQRFLPELIVKAQVYDGLSGQPIPDTELEVTSLALEDQNLQSDEFGYFNFKIKAEDPFIIAAFYGKKSGLYNGLATAADAQEIIRIPLYGPREAQLLNGIVVDEETGDPVENVTVEIIDKTNQQPVAMQQKDGAFNFKALPGNVYHLKFSKSGYKEQTIIVPYNPQVDPKPDLKVVFQRHRPVVTIKGHIYAGLTGSPLPSATIDITSITQQDQTVTSDEFGNFTFEAKISDAFVLMSSYKDLAGYINESVDLGEEFEVIQLPMYKRSDRYEIAGFVVDKNTKKPIVAPEVSIVEQSTGRIVDYEYDEGVLTFSLLPDNTYKVSINKFGYKETKVMLPYYPANSQIPAGFTAYMEPEKEEVMVKGIAINGTTRQPLPDTKISITSLQLADQELISDDNGIFNFKVEVGDAFIIMGTHEELVGMYSGEMGQEQSGLVRLMLLGEDEAVNVAALVVDKITQKPIFEPEVAVSIAGKSIETNLNGATATFKAVKGDSYQIAVQKAGYKDKTIDFEYNPATMPAPVNVKIELEQYQPNQNIAAHVYDGETGNPVADAKVSITSLSMDDQQHQTDTDGNFSFNVKIEDAFIAMVVAGDKTGIFTGQIGLSNQDSILRIPVFDPEDGRTVSGFIVDEQNNQPVENVEIEIIEQKTQQSVVAVQHNGTFNFESKPNSEYKIIAKKDGFEEASIVVPYLPDPENFQLALKRIKTTYSITGHVFDGLSNQAIPNAQVQITGFLSADKSMKTDQYGYFDFEMKVGEPFVVMANFQDKGGHYNGQLTEEDVQKTIEIPLFGPQDPNSTIQVVGFISNMYTGETIENAQIVVTEKNTQRNISFVQQKGLLKFDAVAGETYQLSLSKEGFLEKRMDVPVSIESIDVVKTAIEMQPVKPEVIVRAHIYDGITGEALSNANVNVSSMYLPDQTAHADVNGDFSFTTYADDVFMIAGYKGNKVGKITGNITDLQTYKNNIIMIPAYEENNDNITFTLYVVDRSTGERMFDFEAKIIEDSSQQPIDIIRDNDLDIFELLPDKNYLVTVDKEGYRTATRTINTMFYRNTKVARLKVEMDIDNGEDENLWRAIVLETNEAPVPNVDIYFYNESLKQEKYLSSGEDGIFNFSAGEEDLLSLIGNKDTRNAHLLDFRLVDLERNEEGLIELYMQDGEFKPRISAATADVVMVENLSGRNQFFIQEETHLFEMKNEDSRHVLERKNDRIFVRNKTKNKIDATNWKEEYKELMQQEGISIDNEVLIKNIMYDFDRYIIREAAKVELDKIVETMRKFPEIYLEIKSYADSRGRTKYNDLLAARRSNAVVNYLASQGINKYRVITENYGERELLNDCIDGVNCPEDLHQENRRSEFIIINYSLDNEPLGKLTE